MSTNTATHPCYCPASSGVPSWQIDAQNGEGYPQVQWRCASCVAKLLPNLQSWERKEGEYLSNR